MHLALLQFQLDLHASEASREVANFTEIKNMHTLV